MYFPNETRKWPSIKDVAKSAIAESPLLWEFGPSMSKLGCDNCVQKEMKAMGRRKRKRGAGGNLLDNAKLLDENSYRRKQDFMRKNHLERCAICAMYLRPDDF